MHSVCVKAGVLEEDLNWWLSRRTILNILAALGLSPNCSVDLLGPPGQQAGRGRQGYGAHSGSTSAAAGFPPAELALGPLSVPTYA